MKPGPLSVVWGLRGSDVTLTLTGELDFETSDRFLQAIGEALGERCTSFYVDATRLNFIDSVGIRALVDLAARCDALGASFSFDASPQVDRVLHAVGIWDRMSPQPQPL
jgi:anti-anti-sigma factor